MRFHAPIRPYCLLKYQSIKTYKTPFKYGFNGFNGLKWLFDSEFDLWEVDFAAGSNI